MTKEFARIPFEELSANLEQVFDRVVREKEPIVVEKETGALAVIKPVSPRRRSRQGKPFTREDSLWNIVGMGRSGVSDVSGNKHKYLADAYAPKQE